MKVLGIHDGITATATLLIDGRVVGMASEERFHNQKNRGGFPLRAIEWLLSLTPDRKIDAVGIAGLMPPIESTDAYFQGRHRLQQLFGWAVPASFLRSEGVRSAVMKAYGGQQTRRMQEYQRQLSSLGISAGIEAHEHHLCHAAGALHADWGYDRTRPTLIISVDGSGDLRSGGAWLADGDGIRPLRHFASYDSLGILYSRLTMFLGMKPHEHEYKVMGMAPYAPAKLAAKSRDVFKKYVEVDDDLNPRNRSGTWGFGMVRRMQKDLFLHRFDAVSAGIQEQFEEAFVTLITGWVKRTGVKRVVVTGGCAMNVKANMFLADALPDDCKLFVMPSGGDESISLGAAALSCPELPATGSIMPHLYQGPEFGNDDVEAALPEYSGTIVAEKVEDINSTCAGLLAAGQIVARCSGRMEWGARALGNRSILADPSRADTVRRINQAIKRRDFWMPFAPSILIERATDYVLPLANVERSPFMAVAYRTTKLAQKELVAGIHAADLTCRPQFVEQDQSPEYHALIRAFEARTGIGALLNTSFNLHGFPIVKGPKEAIHTLCNSDLDALVMGDWVVCRKATP